MSLKSLLVQGICWCMCVASNKLFLSSRILLCMHNFMFNLEHMNA